MSSIVLGDSMLVRQYQSGDEAMIAAIHNSAFESFISLLPEIYQYRFVGPEDVLGWIEPEENIIWIAETRNELVGYAQIRVEVEREKQNISVLQFMPAREWDLHQANFAIIPSYQRKGLGTFLASQILDEYAGITQFATAQTYSDNKAGEAFLRSLGFSMHDVFYHPPFSDEYPLVNSSVFTTLELELLEPPSKLNLNARLRRAVIQDAPLVAAIHQSNVWWCDECGTLDWSVRFIKGEFGHTVFVAELHGEVVGEIDYLRDGRIGIGGVLPDLRNQGIGSTMFYELLRVMQKAGFEIAFADSGLTQIEAIKMYERFGFSIERIQNAWVKKLT
ncbi:MAG: GNAT family N-acetyltransferase [Candidatus Thorarchaeota archaeon]